MAATSVADTGAKHGDTVICKKVLATGDPFRFAPESRFTVYEENGVPKVYGRKPETSCGASLWRGYGYEWELVK